MSENLNRHAFNPPTQYHEDMDYSHLRPNIEPGEAEYDMSPFAFFYDKRGELAQGQDITAEDIVIQVQSVTKQPLNNVGIKNMLSWANEELTRYRDGEMIANMKKRQIFKHLFDYDFDFDDPKPKQKRSAA
jgi:hypothetical protein